MYVCMLVCLIIVNRDEAIAQLLLHKYHEDPGCCGWRTAFKLELMSYKYENDFAPVDFRFSKSPRLRNPRVLKEIMTDDSMSLETLEANWNTGKFAAKRKIGYTFSFLLASFCQVVLLTYLLQFQLSDNESEARERWLTTWWRAMLAEVLMSPLVLLAQFYLFFVLWKQCIPKSRDFENLRKLQDAAYHINRLKSSK